MPIKTLGAEALLSFLAGDIPHVLLQLITGGSKGVPCGHGERALGSENLVSSALTHCPCPSL